MGVQYETGVIGPIGAIGRIHALTPDPVHHVHHMEGTLGCIGEGRTGRRQQERQYHDGEWIVGIGKSKARLYNATEAGEGEIQGCSGDG